MAKRGSLLVSLEIVISTSIRGVFLGPRVLVCNAGCGTSGILVVVVRRNVRICVYPIVEVVIRKGGIVSCGIPLPSRTLRCLQQRLLACRLEKLISNSVGFHQVASLRIDVLVIIVVDINS